MHLNGRVAGGLPQPPAIDRATRLGTQAGDAAAIILIIAEPEQAVICPCGLGLWSEAVVLAVATADALDDDLAPPAAGRQVGEPCGVHRRQCPRLGEGKHLGRVSLT